MAHPRKAKTIPKASIRLLISFMPKYLSCFSSKKVSPLFPMHGALKTGFRRIDFLQNASEKYNPHKRLEIFMIEAYHIFHHGDPFR